jgi:tRNA dimethylallyltransferase
MADDSSIVVFIAGPTASGKSAAALALAERFGAEIVNADAMQVYRDLSILSARPGPGEIARAPHHLFGFLGAEARCSAGLWSRAAAGALAGIAERGRRAIVVGGTGLYFKALEEGLSPIPEIPPGLREAGRRRLDDIGLAAFRAELLARDPSAARIPAHDRQRLLRARDVLEATGRPLIAFQSHRSAMIAPPAAALVIEPGREDLYTACDARFDRMMENGALDEARALLARSLDSSLPAMKALGAAELMAHLRGKTSLEEAVDLAKRNTRRFVKRQLTWFRNQTPGWRRANDAAGAVEMLTPAFSP